MWDRGHWGSLCGTVVEVSCTLTMGGHSLHWERLENPNPISQSRTPPPLLIAKEMTIIIMA